MTASDNAANQLRDIITDITAQALSQTYDVEPEVYEHWQNLSRGSVEHEEMRLLYAGEIAFATAAAALLDHALGYSAPIHRQAFPHVYGSAMFGWFHPEDELKKKLDYVVALQQASKPLQTLSHLYENAIPASVRSRYGHFYTRPAIAASMLESIDFFGKETLNARLLDPACGSGVFLVEATQQILKAAEESNLTPRETCQVVARTIHGLDLNPIGILLSEAGIALTLAPLLKQCKQTIDPLHVYITDTLELSQSSVEEDDTVNEIKSRTGAYAEGFTHISANPPYAKYPSNRFSQQQKERFAKTTYGHPNLYGLFLQIGVELLGDKGKIAFINPTSFVSGAYFRNLRKYLTEHLNFHRFESFSKRTGLFAGVLQEVVILCAQKGVQQKTIELREFDAGQKTKVLVANASDVLQGPGMDWAYFISPDELAHNILSAMQKNSIPLQDYGVKVSTGTVVWNRVKDYIVDEEQEGTLPLVWGNAIRPYQFNGLGNRNGKASYAKVGPKTENIIASGPALLVKRMTSKEEKRRLVGCLLPDDLAKHQYYIENHVNVITLQDKATISLDLIVALLNSKPLDYLFRSLNGNTNVSATELRLLPVPYNPEIWQAIQALSYQLSAEEEPGLLIHDRIDLLVCQLYAIESKDYHLLGIDDLSAAA